MILMAFSVGKAAALIEHLAQLGAIGIGQHVGAHRQLLRKLGEGRSSALECATQADRARLDAAATPQAVDDIAGIEPQEAPEPDKQPADGAEEAGLECDAARPRQRHLDFGQGVRNLPARHRPHDVGAAYSSSC